MTICLSIHCFSVSIEHGFIKKSSIPAFSAIVLFSSTACAVNAMIGVLIPILRSSVTVSMPSIRHSLVFVPSMTRWQLLPLTGISKSSRMMSYDGVECFLNFLIATSPFDAISTVQPRRVNRPLEYVRVS
jgi:hypothetical protein